MFGLSKHVQDPIEESNVGDELLSFLNEADDRYIYAFESKSPGALKGFFSIDCIKMIMRWSLIDAGARYFSDKAFRRTSWLIDNPENPQPITKTCVFDNVKVALARTIKVSEDYKERWVVRNLGDSFIVEDIKLLEDEEIW